MDTDVYRDTATKLIDANTLVESYIELGWNPVPISYREKGPKKLGWDKQRVDLTNVNSVFPPNGRWNVGIQLGPVSKNLVDLDIDSPEALSVASFFFPKTEAVFGRTSKPYSHALYYSPELIQKTKKAAIQFHDPAAENKEKGVLIELRCGGGEKGAQTVFPGSVHPSGELITWAEGVPAEPSTVSGDVLLRAGERTAAASLLVRAWPGDGQRHNTRLLVSGFLARCGMPFEEAEHFLQTVSNAAGDKGEDDVFACIKSAYDRLKDGGNVYGLPQLIEMFGEKRAKQIAKWLHYKDEYSKTKVENVLSATGPSIGFDELMTELGNSRRLVRLNLGDIRFSHQMNTWFVWKEGYWQADTNGEIYRLAQQSVEKMLHEAINEAPGPARDMKIEFAVKSQKKRELDAAVALARNDARVVLDYKLLDADPLLVGVENGVIDLRTGSFREGRREDFITKRCGVKYNPAAQCPNWKAFQQLISGDHPGLIEYKQLALGLLLSGEVPEILFIAHGLGANGKTTELETIAQILGGYSHASDASLLVTTKEGGGANPEIVAVRGKRAVFINETAQSDWLNEQRVKYLTGTDQMSGRNLYQSIINWKPTHKCWLRTNHKPKIRGNDYGLWRRIHYIPYTKTIAQKDAKLNFREDYLVPELPGILNWMLEGWMAYLKAGRRLDSPKCVQEANTAYKKESDVTGKWVAGSTLRSPGEERIPLKHLYNMYREWFAEEVGERGYIASSTLAKSLEDAGYIREESRNRTYFSGLALVPHVFEDREELKRDEMLAGRLTLPKLSPIRVHEKGLGNVGQGANISTPSKNPFVEFGGTSQTETTTPQTEAKSREILLHELENLGFNKPAMPVNLLGEM